MSHETGANMNNPTAQRVYGESLPELPENGSEGDYELILRIKANLEKLLIRYPYLAKDKDVRLLWEAINEALLRQ